MADVIEIAKRIAYYEKRHMHVEADCRNLESRYKENDDSANGFLVAIRRQEHWNGENFELIARKLLEINPGKICQYVILRSIDCSENMRQEIFNPNMYTLIELEGLARAANSNAILVKIFEYAKQNVYGGERCTFLTNIALNPAVEAKLFDELYAYYRGVANQIFYNIGCKASTELLMRMLNENDLQWLHVAYLLQYKRDDIYEQLANWSGMTPELLSRFLRYSYHTGEIDYKWVKIVEDRMISLTDYIELYESDLEEIIAGTHNQELIKKIMTYLDSPTE